MVRSAPLLLLAAEGHLEPDAIGEREELVSKGGAAYFEALPRPPQEKREIPFEPGAEGLLAAGGCGCAGGACLVDCAGAAYASLTEGACRLLGCRGFQLSMLEGAPRGSSGRSLKRDALYLDPLGRWSRCRSGQV